MLHVIFILQVLFYDDEPDADANIIAFAAYSNFTVGPGPNYKLLSLGDYHGTAGKV